MNQTLTRTTPNRAAFQSFQNAVTAVCNELDTRECRIFRDSDSSFSAIVLFLGCEAPQSAGEDGATDRVLFSVSFAMTAGFDAVHLMVEQGNRTQTGATRISEIETRGSDVLESLCQKIGIRSYV